MSSAREYIGVDFGVLMIFRAVSLACIPTPKAVSAQLVLCLVYRLKVARINAGGIAAEMVYMVCFRNWPYQMLVSPPMCHSIAATRLGNVTVPLLVPAGRPVPAETCDLNFLPES